jgi:hypothetical protein
MAKGVVWSPPKGHKKKKKKVLAYGSGWIADLGVAHGHGGGSATPKRPQKKKKKKKKGRVLAYGGGRATPLGQGGDSATPKRPKKKKKNRTTTPMPGGWFSNPCIFKIKFLKD